MRKKIIICYKTKQNSKNIKKERWTKDKNEDKKYGDEKILYTFLLRTKVKEWIRTRSVSILSLTKERKQNKGLMEAIHLYKDTQVKIK